MKEVVMLKKSISVTSAHDDDDDEDDEIDLLNNSNLKNHFIEIQNSVWSEHITELSRLPFRKLHPLSNCLTRRRGIEKTEFRG